jgi:acetyltransferase
VGTVLVIGLFGGYGVRFDERLTAPEIRGAERMAEAAAEAGKALVVHTMYAAHRTRPLEILGTAGIPVVGSLETACRCAIELERRGRHLARPGWSPEVDAGEVSGNAGAVLDAALREGRTLLAETEARSVLSDHGLAFPESVVVASAEEAADRFGEIGGLAAAKLVSTRITHKSDAGAVVLDLADASGASRAFDHIARAAAAWTSAQGLEEEAVRVLLTPMLPTPRMELLVGAARDPGLGPVLTLGAGGVWVEVLADVAHRVLPVPDAEIEAMLDQVRSARVLNGGRGHLPVDRRPVVAAARAVAETLLRHPEIVEIDVNPLFVYPDRVVPVDARVVLGPAR